MFLIIIKVIRFVLGFVAAASKSEFTRLATIARVLGVILIFIGVASSMIVQIELGEGGVQKLFGKVDNDALESGLSFVNPMVEVVPINQRQCRLLRCGVIIFKQKR